MCNVVAVGAVGSAMMGVSSYNSSQASAKAAEYQADIYNQNAQIATTNAVNERQAGYDAANRIEMSTASDKARQMAAMGANGIVANEGSAADLLDTTEYFGEMDSLTTVKNSNSRANAYLAEADNYRMQSGLSSMSANNYRNGALLGALGTTMTGLGQVKSSWGSFTKTGTSLPVKTNQLPMP